MARQGVYEPRIAQKLGEFMLQKGPKIGRCVIYLAQQTWTAIDHSEDVFEITAGKVITFASALAGIQFGRYEERRKRDFFKKLKQNLGNDNPHEQERLVDQFRNLILGH